MVGRRIPRRNNVVLLSRPFTKRQGASYAVCRVIALAAVGGCGSLVTQSSIPADTHDSDASGEALGPQLAGRLALDAVESAAQAVAVVLPTKDMQRIFEGAFPPPVCPGLDVVPSPDEFVMTLDYGAGCSPAPYESVFSGSADGRFYPAYYGFDLSLRECRIDDAPLNGTIGGSAVPSQDVATFVVTLGVERGDGTLVQGTPTVIVEETGGLFRLADGAELSIATATMTVHVTLEGVVVDAATTGNFLPLSGTATVNASSSNDSPDASAIVVEFTSQTPLDRTVRS